MIGHWTVLLFTFLSPSTHAVQVEDGIEVAGWNGKRQLSQTNASQAIQFYAMSDTPFGNRERQGLSEVLRELENRAGFLVHLGDSHERRMECEESRYAFVAETFKSNVVVPTFFLPGDNDWYECADQNRAWTNWTNYFLSFQDNWPHQLKVSPQHERPENFAFIYKSTLFVGFHVISATVTDWEAWNSKVHDDSVWLRRVMDWHRNDPTVAAIVLMSHAHPHHRRYRVFIEAIEEVTPTIAKPIMYLQGDLQEFHVDRPFVNQRILRVAVGKGNNESPTEINIDPSSENPFRIKRRS